MELRFFVLLAMPLGPLGLRFECPKLSILDEFNSKTEAGRLYYRLPAAHTMLGDWTTAEDMKRLDQLETYLSVQSGNNTLSCKNKPSCKVMYRWAYTPIIYYLTSPVMYHGQRVDLYFNPMAAPDYKRSDQYFADLRLNGVRFLTEDYGVANKVHKWRTQSVKGLVRSK